jgi:molybdopterin converting factor small subunit
MINTIKKHLRSIQNNTFNDKLINKLKKDHMTLLNIFSLLKSSIENQQTKKSLKTLNKFLKELELHLLLENSQLYTHIETKYKLCNLKNIQDIKNEIEKNSFLFEELKSFIEEKNFNEAKKTLEKIEDFLLKRIQYEEKKLYKLYLNAYKCENLKDIL